MYMATTQDRNELDSGPLWTRNTSRNANIPAKLSPSTAMPREIITLQVGQCGNQSELLASFPT